MAWTIEYLTSTRKQLKCLDSESQRRIVRFMRERVMSLGDPRALGRSLTGPWAGCWRYRVGDYRIICLFVAGELRVIVVKAGHRREIYDKGPTAEIILLTEAVARTRVKEEEK